MMAQQRNDISTNFESSIRDFSWAFIDGVMSNMADYLMDTRNVDSLKGLSKQDLKTRLYSFTGGSPIRTQALLPTNLHPQLATPLAGSLQPSPAAKTTKAKKQSNAKWVPVDEYYRCVEAGELVCGYLSQRQETKNKVCCADLDGKNIKYLKNETDQDPIFRRCTEHVSSKGGLKKESKIESGSTPITGFSATPGINQFPAALGQPSKLPLPPSLGLGKMPPGIPIPSGLNLPSGLSLPKPQISLPPSLQIPVQQPVYQPPPQQVETEISEDEIGVISIGDFNITVGKMSNLVLVSEDDTNKCIGKFTGDMSDISSLTEEIIQTNMVELTETEKTFCLDNGIRI